MYGPALDALRGIVEPNDGDIRNHNNRLQATLEHHLNDAWQLRLASHYKQGSLWGDASENRPLDADGHTLNRRFRSAPTIARLPRRGWSIP